MARDRGLVKDFLARPDDAFTIGKGKGKEWDGIEALRRLYIVAYAIWSG
jgi:hypothetical protein